jgi:hypothetical protein
MTTKVQMGSMNGQARSLRREGSQPGARERGAGAGRGSGNHGPFGMKMEIIPNGPWCYGPGLTRARP